MVYIAGQILVCLLIAALFGFIIGWLLRGRLVKDRIDGREKIWKINIATLEKELELARSQLKTRLQTSDEIMGKSAISESRDDLTRIRGISQYLQGRLNECGILTFKQLSQLDANTIAQLSKEIGPFPDRIVRDQWVQQARELIK